MRSTSRAYLPIQTRQYFLDLGSSHLLRPASDHDLQFLLPARLQAPKANHHLQQAAAPQPPQVAHSTATSTSSLIDVDTPSVRTVPSTYSQQDVQTETQRDRISREAEALERQAADKAERAKKAAWRDAQRADGWLNAQFSRLTDGQSGALVAANLAGLVGLGVFVGYKAWGLYEKGRLGWKEAGIGLGIIGAVSAVEAVFGRYLYKAKKGKGKGKGQ